MITIDRRTSLLLVTGALMAAADMAVAQAYVKYMGEDALSAIQLQQFAVTASWEKRFLEFEYMYFNDRVKTVSDANNSGIYQNVTETISGLNSSIRTT